MKVSYGCMPNMAAIINGHNKKVLEENQPLERGGCNCQRRYRNNCPLDGECLSTKVLYEARLSSTEENYDDKIYKGITKPEFKSRLGNHTQDFNNRKNLKSTELSKEVWSIKDKGYQYAINWRIIKQYQTYTPASKKCMLCLNEKLEILEHNGNNILNKRTELVSKCRHRNEYMISQYDPT